MTPVLLLSLVAGCMNPAAPSSDTVSEPPVDPNFDAVAVDVYPVESLLQPGDTLHFRAEFRMANGKVVEADSVEWSSDEGEVDDQGRFVAPNKKGKYHVVGRGRNKPSGQTLTDTAEVTVADAADGADLAPADVIVTPGSAQLESGETLRYAAELRNAEGVAVAGAVIWTANGGNIDNTGRFTAGEASGTFAITAEAAENGVRGTASAVVSETTSTNQEPQANFSHACTDLFCSFDGSASSDADGSIVAYEWSFDDGSAASVVAPDHTFASAGSYAVRLTVRDNDGSEASRTQTVTVSESSSPPPAPSYDVAIFPGENIQEIANANPNGTRFLIKAGTHLGQQVEPKDDQQFIGEAGTVLDGQDTRAFAFGSYGIPGARVVIRGITIQNYRPQTIQRGAIQGDNAVNWLVEGNVVRDNRGVGIRLGRGMMARGNHTYGNDNLGIGGYLAHGATVEDNEIDGNGFAGLGGEHAGMKILAVDNLTVRGNRVHDNVGRGIWLDTNIFDAVVENNIVEDNTQEGIWLEVVCGAVARYNTVRRNGLGGPNNSGYPLHAGIEVQNGTNVEIYGNTVEDNHNGVSILGATGYPEHECSPNMNNVYVHDNIVRQSRGAAAGAADNRDDVDYSTIRFENNTYTLSGDAGFVWRGETMSYSQWQSEGRQ